MAGLAADAADAIGERQWSRQTFTSAERLTTSTGPANPRDTNLRATLCRVQSHAIAKGPTTWDNTVTENALAF